MAEKSAPPAPSGGKSSLAGAATGYIKKLFKTTQKEGENLEKLLAPKIDEYEKNTLEYPTGNDFEDYLQTLIMLLLDGLFTESKKKNDKNDKAEPPNQDTKLADTANRILDSEEKENKNTESKLDNNSEKAEADGEKFDNPFSHVPEDEKRDLWNFMTAKAHEEEQKKDEKDRDPRVEKNYNSMLSDTEHPYKPDYVPKFTGTDKEIEGLNSRFGINVPQNESKATAQNAESEEKKNVSPFSHVPEDEKRDLLNFMTVKAYEDDLKKNEADRDPDNKEEYDKLMNDKKTPEEGGYDKNYVPKFTGTPEEKEELNKRFEIPEGKKVEANQSEVNNEVKQPEVKQPEVKQPEVKQQTEAPKIEPTKPEPTNKTGPAYPQDVPKPQVKAADANTKAANDANGAMQNAAAAAASQSQTSNKSTIALSNPNDKSQSTKQTDSPQVDSQKKKHGMSPS